MTPERLAEIKEYFLECADEMGEELFAYVRELEKDKARLVDASEIVVEAWDDKYLALNETCGDLKLYKVLVNMMNTLRQAIDNAKEAQ